jgi:ribosome-associated protein
VIADYFVICNGENVTQVRTIAERVQERLREQGVRPLRTEGLGFAHWVLMDYGDVIVHIFEAETRAYYELEKLWLDAPRLPLPDEIQAGVGRQDKRALPR